MGGQTPLSIDESSTSDASDMFDSNIDAPDSIA